MNTIKGLGHFLIQPPVHLLKLPVKIISILDLFEIGDGNTACICQKIRQYNYSSFIENAIRFRGGGPVCKLTAYFAFQAGRIIASYDIFQGSRKKDGHR